MNDKRKTLAVKIIDMALIFILAASTIAMFIGYNIIKNSTSYSSLPEFDFRTSGDLFIESDNELYSESELELISPCFVGFVGSRNVTPVLPSVRHQFLAEVRPFLLSVLSDISTLIEFSSETARTDYIRENIYEKDSYIYFEFENELPASAIYPAVSGKTLENVYHAFGVKKLFVFCNDGFVSGIALDSDGRVATLTERDKTALSFDVLSSYTEADGMADFEFMNYNLQYYAVIRESVSRPDLVAYNNSGDFLLKNSDNAATILNAFGFNPNGTRFFTTEDSITYVEEKGDLIISESGDILYTETDGGIDISALSGIKKESYSFEDKIVAAHDILGNLDRQFFGGYADLSLSDISYDDKEASLCLDFEYCTNGIRIQNNESPAARLIFKQNSLVYASVTARAFSLFQTSYTDIPQKLLYIFASGDFEKEAPPQSFVPVYTEKDNVYSAKYAFIYSKDIESDEEVAE